MLSIPDIELKKRRVAVLRITPAVLVELFKNKDPITLSFAGLPEDARLLSVRANPETEDLDFLIESETLHEMLPGATYWRFSLTVTRHYLLPNA